MKHILIIEDERAVAELERDYLEINSFKVYIEETGEGGLQRALKGDIDLIILDLMLPDMDGFEICRELRHRIDIPILIVSAKKSDIDKIRGLGNGADDYITKPFGVMELISRVKAMLRRSQKSQEKDKVLKLGNIVLDREKHSVTVGKEPVELTYKEYELLKLLMTNAGIVTTRELILDRVWGIDFEGESRTLDMHIKTLRQKLKEEGSLIKTVRNVGYIMNGEKA